MYNKFKLDVFMYIYEYYKIFISKIFYDICAKYLFIIKYKALCKLIN